MEERNEKLWKLAKKRANTKRNGLIYLTIVLFLWLIWLSNNDFKFSSNMIYAWPKWPTLALAIAFVFEYIDAFYKDNDSLIEKEYNKLIKKNNNESTI
jgi:hypothetical protein